MKTSAAHLLWVFASGLGIGLFFFGGLWLTVRRISRVKHPALLSLSSFIIRTALSLVLFHTISGSHWERLLALLCGFLLMRFALVHLIRPTPNRIEPQAEMKWK